MYGSQLRRDTLKGRREEREGEGGGEREGGREGGRERVQKDGRICSLASSVKGSGSEFSQGGKIRGTPVINHDL